MGEETGTGLIIGFEWVWEGHGFSRAAQSPKEIGF